MNEKKIIIKTPPVPQGRPRFASRGKFTVAFDPNKDKKNWARLQAAQQIENPIEDPLKVEITFYMTIPKSTSKKKKKQMLNYEIAHTKKPDIDNLLKFILDALNTVAFRDDSQIWSVIAEKVYSEDPRTEIILTY